VFASLTAQHHAAAGSLSASGLGMQIVPQVITTTSSCALRPVLIWSSTQFTLVSLHAVDLIHCEVVELG